MRKSSIRLIATALLVLLCLPAQAQEGASDKPLSPEEMGRIVDKVESNWNIVAEAVASCKERLIFDVRLGVEGSVEDVILTSPESPEAADSCRSLADSARRAILISSPLPVPSNMAHVKLVFDISEFQ